MSADAWRIELRRANSRTLSHLLLTDRVQLGRFIGPDKTVSYDADRNPIAIKSLAQELYSDFETLRREREATDTMIKEWTEKISAEWLITTMRYHSMSDGGDWDVPLWVAVAHFFNHQTHHRGQVTPLLNQFGLDPGRDRFHAAIPLSGPGALACTARNIHSGRIRGGRSDA